MSTPEEEFFQEKETEMTCEAGPIYTAALLYDLEIEFLREKYSKDFQSNITFAPKEVVVSAEIERLIELGIELEEINKELKDFQEEVASLSELVSSDVLDPYYARLDELEKKLVTTAEEFYTLLKRNPVLSELLLDETKVQTMTVEHEGVERVVVLNKFGTKD